MKIIMFVLVMVFSSLFPFLSPILYLALWLHYTTGCVCFFYCVHVLFLHDHSNWNLVFFVIWQKRMGAVLNHISMIISSSQTIRRKITILSLCPIFDSIWFACRVVCCFFPFIVFVFGFDSFRYALMKFCPFPIRMMGKIYLITDLFSAPKKFILCFNWIPSKWPKISHQPTNVDDQIRWFCIRNDNESTTN